MNSLIKIALLILLSLNLNASFFGDLFSGTKTDQDVQITEEDAIIEQQQLPVEEEVISADEYLDSEDEPTEIEVFSNNIENTNMAFDENEELNEDSFDEDPFIKAESIFLSYLDQPQKIYLSQHSKLKIKAIITQENIANIKTSFLDKKDIKILNPNSSWRKVSDNSYENSYTIKTLSTSSRLPKIKITVTTKDGRSYSKTLEASHPKIVALREDKEFCFVLSEDFTLKSHHEKKYDERSNIVVLEINASNSNLEDFHIPYAIRDGIDEIKYSGDDTSIYYYAIIPNGIKIFKFKYFDLISNKYNIVSFPIVLQDSSVSTQTELNPGESRYALYKTMALVVLAIIFFLFYLKNRKLYLLIFSLILIAFVIYIQIPISKIMLHKGMKLRILPTENSTIFYITDSDTKADILLKKDGYIKVLLPNKKIGWIDEDFTKN